MKRFIASGAAALVVGALVTAPAHGQASIFVSGGPTFPMSDFGDYAKTGWMAMAGVNVPVGTKGWSVGGDLVYGSNSHSDVNGDKTNLPGAFGFLQYRVGPTTKTGVYFYGQAGALNHQFRSESVPSDNASEWGFAYGGGAGVDIPLKSVSLFFEGSIIVRDGTNLVPVVAGISIPVGKKKA